MVRQITGRGCNSSSVILDDDGKKAMKSMLIDDEARGIGAGELIKKVEGDNAKGLVKSLLMASYQEDGKKGDLPTLRAMTRILDDARKRGGECFRRYCGAADFACATKA